MNRSGQRYGYDASNLLRKLRQRKYWIRNKVDPRYKKLQAAGQKRFRIRHKNDTLYKIKKKEWNRMYMKKAMQNPQRKEEMRLRTRERLRRFRQRQKKKILIMEKKLKRAGKHLKELLLKNITILKKRIS